MNIDPTATSGAIADSDTADALTPEQAFAVWRDGAFAHGREGASAQTPDTPDTPASSFSLWRSAQDGDAFSLSDGEPDDADALEDEVFREAASNAFSGLARRPDAQASNRYVRLGSRPPTSPCGPDDTARPRASAATHAAGNGAGNDDDMVDGPFLHAFAPTPVPGNLLAMRGMQDPPGTIRRLAAPLPSGSAGTVEMLTRLLAASVHLQDAGVPMPERRLIASHLLRLDMMAHMIRLNLPHPSWRDPPCGQAAPVPRSGGGEEQDARQERLNIAFMSLLCQLQQAKLLDREALWSALSTSAPGRHLPSYLRATATALKQRQEHTPRLQLSGIDHHYALGVAQLLHVLIPALGSRPRGSAGATTPSPLSDSTRARITDTLRDAFLDTLLPAETAGWRPGVALICRELRVLGVAPQAPSAWLPSGWCGIPPSPPLSRRFKAALGPERAQDNLPPLGSPRIDGLAWVSHDLRDAIDWDERKAAWGHDLLVAAPPSLLRRRWRGEDEVDAAIRASLQSLWETERRHAGPAGDDRQALLLSTLPPAAADRIVTAFMNGALGASWRGAMDQELRLGLSRDPQRSRAAAAIQAHVKRFCLEEVRRAHTSWRQEVELSPTA